MHNFILQVRSFSDYQEEGEGFGKIIGLVLVGVIVVAAIGYFVSKNRAKFRHCDNCGKKEEKEKVIAVRLKRSGKVVEFCSETCKTVWFDKRRRPKKI